MKRGSTCARKLFALFILGLPFHPLAPAEEGGIRKSLIALITSLALLATQTPASACTRALYVATGAKTCSGDDADKFVEAKLFNFASLDTKFEESKK